MSLEVLFFLMGAVPVAIGAGVIASRPRRGRLMLAFAGDDEHVLDPIGLFTYFRLRRRDGRAVLEYTSEQGVIAFAEGVRLSAQTTMTIRPKRGLELPFFGARPLTFEDAQLDATIELFGEDEDLVRGTVALANVKSALRALFNRSDVVHCALSREGTLSVLFRRGDLVAVDLRERLRLVADLAEALSGANGVAKRIARPDQAGAVSSISGVPVGVTWKPRGVTRKPRDR